MHNFFYRPLIGGNKFELFVYQTVCDQKPKKIMKTGGDRIEVFELKKKKVMDFS